MRLADDERLASLAAGGDERAFGLLAARHEARLLSVSRSVLRSDDDAGDAVQNALLKAFRALQAGQLRGEPRPWLARIAHNEARSLARGRREFAPLLADTLGVSGDPHELLVVRERWAALVDDVAALPERLRRPLLLRAEAGLPYAAIARELDVTELAARRAVSDARALLEAAADARDADCAEIRSILRGTDRRRHRSRRVRGHLRTCASCRAWRPQRRQLLLAPFGFLVSATEWLSSFFAAGGATALRSTAVVAAVASGSLAVVSDAPRRLPPKVAVAKQEPKRTVEVARVATPTSTTERKVTARVVAVADQHPRRGATPAPDDGSPRGRTSRSADTRTPSDDAPTRRDGARPDGARPDTDLGTDAFRAETWRGGDRPTRDTAATRSGGMPRDARRGGGSGPGGWRGLAGSRGGATTGGGAG
ncbi:sigma-70 family RNA polymerase sigma factor [Solirubrobacter soli]|uniref:sigma-70 family RNA polymerase sigma factor n=1 Tax=Solirubrobacter soli TaxID=363832 RepID=UPI00041BA4DA|nr:sigma-70 family RNA polymerase sigma factor [Solirubrobacter soli]